MKDSEFQTMIDKTFTWPTKEEAGFAPDDEEMEILLKGASAAFANEDVLNVLRYLCTKHFLNGPIGFAFESVFKYCEGRVNDSLKKKQKRTEEMQRDMDMLAS